MNTYALKARFRVQLADTVTPVGLYLKLRDRFVNTLLLESSDYHSHQNSYSFIACQPIAEIVVDHDRVRCTFPDGQQEDTPLTDTSLVAQWAAFGERFRAAPDLPEHLPNGFFGYQCYDVVQHFEDLELRHRLPSERRIPLLRYQLFRFVLAINHFKNEMHLMEFTHNDAPFDDALLDEMTNLISRQRVPTYPFAITGEEDQNLPDSRYLEMVAKGRQHCLRGDVFQIVLSRRFSTPFRGDEFNVYRALRSINPSPYLFYFDYGDFRLFGSSPEAQITVEQERATIYPIAGTFRRTGDDHADAELARQLHDDPKENAEHVMLVDLARNDLSRSGTDVTVKTFKEIQYYSHVIHLVSEVTARLPAGSPLQLVADTFPAGTLSGAPKYRAVQLIDEHEPDARGYYGGCLGYWGLNGDFNHAIMIRSMLSLNNRLYYQAGAGVVARSVPESELAEVNNKLGALRQALQAGESV